MIETPEDFELLGFFEREPVETIPEDGFYVYEFTDRKEITLILSFNEIEGSVQIRLIAQGSDVALFSQEGAKKISIEDDSYGCYLRFLFELNGAHAEATIRISPQINIKWSTLQQ